MIQLLGLVSFVSRFYQDLDFGFWLGQRSFIAALDKVVWLGAFTIWAAIDVRRSLDRVDANRSVVD